VLVSATAITIVIQLANLSGAPAPIVRDAQQAVAEILADIDVAVEWRQASGSRPGGSRVVRLTMLPYEGGVLRSHDGPVMGTAARTDQGTALAWVYYQRVIEEADHHLVPPARLLACVIAHEIGHLVLDSPGHEPDGLMRAVWNAADFRRASIGRLRFATAARRRLRVD
jgi:hypothetical protein